MKLAFIEIGTNIMHIFSGCDHHLFPPTPTEQPDYTTTYMRQGTS